MEQERLHHPWLSPLAAFFADKVRLDFFTNQPTTATATRSAEPPRAELTD
jgi:hypothetical protein